MWVLCRYLVFKVWSFQGSLRSSVYNMVSKMYVVLQCRLFSSHGFLSTYLFTLDSSWNFLPILFIIFAAGCVSCVVVSTVLGLLDELTPAGSADGCVSSNPSFLALCLYDLSPWAVERVVGPRHRVKGSRRPSCRGLFLEGRMNDPFRYNSTK